MDMNSDRMTLQLTASGRPSLPLTFQRKDEPASDPLAYAEEAAYADSCYRLSFQGSLLSQRGTVASVALYMNDEPEECRWDGHTIFFVESNGIGERLVFQDAFGFAGFQITVSYTDGRKENWFSDLITVLVPRSAPYESIHRMLDYIYQREEGLTAILSHMPEKVAGQGSSPDGTFAERMLLAHHIAKVYEENYGYFKANARFRIRNEETVDRLEKLSYIDASTVAYAVQHPENLRQVSGPGIPHGGRNYLPQRMRMTRPVCTTDIYENRMVVSFLAYMCRNMEDLDAQLTDLQLRIPETGHWEDGDYLSSAQVMYREVRRGLNRTREELNQTRELLQALLFRYRQALQVTEEPFALPRPTAIFRSVPQYNRIFLCMDLWLKGAAVTFHKEEFTLKFLRASTIYEYYLLASFLSLACHRGFAVKESAFFEYRRSSRWIFDHGVRKNTYVLQRGEEKLTVYYEPILYADAEVPNNGIALYRNTTLSLNRQDLDEAPRGGYYVPDIVLKYEKDGRERYLICDAKFSRYDTVMARYCTDLTYKYLVSISPAGDWAEHYGMCILYGKVEDHRVVESMYDRQRREIRPYAMVTPYGEEMTEEERGAVLGEVLDKLMR